MVFNPKIAGLNVTPSTYGLITQDLDITPSSPNSVTCQVTVPLGIVVTGGGFKMRYYLNGAEVEPAASVVYNVLKAAPIPYIGSESWQNVAVGWEVKLRNSTGWFVDVDTGTQFNAIKLTVYACVGTTWTYGIRD